MKSKKRGISVCKGGSLSLSVNAIVVLILAVTMLGLSLGFIRGMFGKASNMVTSQVEQEPEPAASSGFQPITLSRENVISRAGNKETIKVSVFNPSSSPLADAKPTIACSNLGATAVSNPRTIEAGQAANFVVVLDVPAAAANTYLCRVSVTGISYQKDMTIKIEQ